MTRMKMATATHTRRKILQTLAGSAGSMALISVIPTAAQAELLVPDQVFGAMADRMGDLNFREGTVVLTMPDRADTGLSVPITVGVTDSPMTNDNYVKSLHIFTELNPQPLVADYYLTPRSGRAQISTRIRLARSQFVYAGAVMSDQTAWVSSFFVTVTLGACAADIFLPDAKEALERRKLERDG